MEHRTTAQAQALDQLHRQALSRVGDADVQSALGSLGKYLVDSEAQLIALMNKKQPPTGGQIELGMVLYWIHHDLPDDKFFRFIAKHFPPTQITAPDIKNWEKTWQGPGAVAGDGTLFGYGTFEQLDKGWLFSTVLYVLTVLSELPKAPFGTTPLRTQVGSGSKLRVAILGDWGSGAWNDGGTQGPAAEIMAQINALSPQPDVVIHLGDVYYSGTGELPLGIGVALFALGAKIGVPFDPWEENHRLLAPWWKGGKSGNSFTLNSNHEMYSAARGYFRDALGSALFAAQNNTSYFALEFQDWVILGLDSAYYSDSIAVMEGRLQDSTHAEQVAWVQGLDLSGKKVIALTHHTALTYDGLPVTGSDGAPTLVDDMREALNGKDPDYWYWGHIHNGIVYTDAASPGTKSRCVGHAALPFGAAYYWENNTQYPLSDSLRVAYCSNTRKPNPQKNPRWDNRVLNGFALLTLGKGTITEEFYEQCNPDPVWPRS